MALKASDRNCLNCARSENNDADLLCRKPIEDQDDIAYPETVVTLGVVSHGATNVATGSRPKKNRARLL